LANNIPGTPRGSAYRNQNLHPLQRASEGNNEIWHQYVIRHETGTNAFLEEGDPDESDTILKFYVDGQRKFEGCLEGEGPQAAGKTTMWRSRCWWSEVAIQNNMGNFASLDERTATFTTEGTNALQPPWPDQVPMLPQTFMIGGVEYFDKIANTLDGAVNEGYPDGKTHVSTINGYIGMWGLWNRALQDEEIDFLRKSIVPVNRSSFTRERLGQLIGFGGAYVPRLYEECSGAMSTLTGGTGDGLPEGAAPLLYGSGTLVAWWDGSTGDLSIGNGLVDIHTGGYHLTGSGDFVGIEKTYREASITALSNYTPSNPRFGGFPGTDGFSYGQTL
jgi:hypothetical protein